MDKQKGFTIIELIVVIAIIAVLAGIVLVNVTQYINKAKVTAVKADMYSLNRAAADYFITNGTFNGICANSSGFSTVSVAVNKILGEFYCRDGAVNPTICTSSGVWAAEVRLPDNITYWCVDYSGKNENGNGNVRYGYICSCP
jgi:prepilin-type N-terminal cleavage/methylation domain-containing protein